MNVRKVMEIELDEEALEMLNQGEALQVPIDQEQGIALYPPREASEATHE